MHENNIKELTRLSLNDYLTVDSYDKKISIRNAKSDKAVPLITPERFFREDGLYVKPQDKGLKIIANDDEDQYGENDEASYIKLDDLIKEMDDAVCSYVLLIEGYAGCGKSTLVQDILQKKLGFDSNYSLYNYNIEEKNRELKSKKKNVTVANSSIFNAIITCFIDQLCEYYEEVYDDFNTIISFCKKFTAFKSAYTTVNGDSFIYAIKSIKNNDKEAAFRNLFKQLRKKDPTCILAIDYIFRLAMWRRGKIRELYICYDNLDAIEDATDLKGFDNKLTSFRGLLDSFINDNYDYFYDHALHRIPRFVIMATYRKITSVLAELDYYTEVNDDVARGARHDYVKRIDATSTFSYKEIVEKRTEYFKRYFDAYPLDEETKQSIDAVMHKLEEWNGLNRSLEIMQDRYSVLWNRNYRTCSEIADILFSKSKYKFEKYIKFIEGLSNLDGYYSEMDEQGNRILCTYLGKSAILLNSVCHVFKHRGIWDAFLNLTSLHPTEPKDYKADYKDVSLSRLVLTYIYNKKYAGIDELYTTFCSKGLFTADQLCDCLSVMITRNSSGVWRRPLYYYNECIVASTARAIKTELLGECDRLKNGLELEHEYSFQLCDSGQAYVERLMSEFEFYSSRLIYRNHKDNMPLYMYNNLNELRRIMHEVYCSVHSCCMNMMAFGDIYRELYNLSSDGYLNLDFHPKTNRGKRQLHIERIVFSHIAYLNNARLYFVDERITANMDQRKQYNDLFVRQISEYLELYYNIIYSISQDREKVYRELLAKVKTILNESKKEHPNEKLLFQSISLSHKS